MTGAPATSDRDLGRGARARWRSEFAVCVATFYEDLAERLVNGARRGLRERRRQRGPRSTPSRSPAPSSCRWPRSCCAESGRFAGVACLGVVIRGETDHYDYVCAEARRGIQHVQLETGVPCAFGVITCDDDGAGAGPRRRRQARPGPQRRARRRCRMALSLAAAARAARPATIHASAMAKVCHSCGKGPAFGQLAAATRWSPPGGASTRTCRRSGSRRAARTRRVYVCTRCLKAEQGHQGRLSSGAHPARSPMADPSIERFRRGRRGRATPTSRRAARRSTT